MGAERDAGPGAGTGGPAGLTGLFLVASIVAGCATPVVTGGAGGGTAGPGGGSRSAQSPVHAGEGEPLPGIGDLVPPAPAEGAAAGTRQPGGYYLDDGPGDRTAAELALLMARPDPVPVVEPLHSRANRPYRVLGNDYRPMTRREPFTQRGIGSWYGKKFHGQLTSIGERYDMYSMTAAHPTLPIPSFVRVTNLENDRQVVVRVNDRGPFLHGRVIDLSYLAAYKLGYVKAGSARVQVELLDPANLPPALPSPASPSAPMATVSPATAQESTATTAATSVPAGHFLQLGAFSVSGNAEAASRDLRRRLDWLQVPIEVAPAGRLYRVQAGPFELREQAVRAGTQVESRTGLRPVLLDR